MTIDPFQIDPPAIPFVPQHEHEHPKIWMAQQTGRPLWLLDLRPEDICLTSMNVAMDHIARYNGHTRMSLNLTSHSLFVERLVAMRWPEHVEARLYAMLHDAHEVFWGDLTRPVQLAFEQLLPGFRQMLKEVHEKTDRVIFTALGLPGDFPSSVARTRVAEADTAALWFERSQYIGTQGPEWVDDHVAEWWKEKQLQHGLWLAYKREMSGWLDAVRELIVAWKHRE